MNCSTRAWSAKCLAQTRVGQNLRWVKGVLAHSAAKGMTLRMSMCSRGNVSLAIPEIGRNTRRSLQQPAQCLDCGVAFRSSRRALILLVGRIHGYCGPRRLRWTIGHPSSKTVFAEVPGIVAGLFALRLTAADLHSATLPGHDGCCRCSKTTSYLFRDHKRA